MKIKRRKGFKLKKVKGERIYSVSSMQLGEEEIFLRTTKDELQVYDNEKWKMLINI